MGSSKRDIELEEQLKEAGTLLLCPPSSADELIDLLDRVENLLASVEQAPSRAMQDALLPSLKALIMNELLRHPDPDVRLSLASCFSEITRITAPEAPYGDELMKEIFQLIVAAFEKLPHASGRCYMKAVSILDTVAKVRSCLLMLDLECDALIIEMFRHFLKTIRSNHPHAVFLAMETIMTLVIDESEDVSWDLLSILLDSVRKENQDVSPTSWKLAEKVITNCSAKLKSNLMEAVQCRGIALDEYAEIVASICGDGCENFQRGLLSGTENLLASKEPDSFCPGEVCHDVHGTFKLVTSNGTAPSRNENSFLKDNSSKVIELSSHLEHSKSVDARCSAGPGNLEPLRTVKSEIELESAPKKRGRKPNSLMNPEEGYDHSWISTRRKDPKVSGQKMVDDKGADCSPSVNQDSKKKAYHKKVGHGTSSSPKSDCFDVSGHARSRLKKRGSVMNQDADASYFSVSPSTQGEEKASGSVDLSLRKEPEDRAGKEIKRSKRSKINEETSGPPEYGDSERKVEVPSDLKEKPWQLSVTKKRCRSTNDDWTAVQPDISKVNVVATSTKSVTEAAGAKKMISKAAVKSSNRDGNYVEGTPKTEVRKKHTAGKEEKKVIPKAAKSSAGDENHSEKTPKTGVKRKHTKGKETASETPGLGEQLVGRKIKVWWPMDKMFYEGLVDSYDDIKKKHRILYADGDEEILNLKRQRWELIGDGKLSEGQQETNELKPDVSTDKLKKKEESEFELLKKMKSSSLKRSTPSASSSKSKAKNSRGSSSNCVTADKPIKVDESKTKAKEKNRSPKVDEQTSPAKLILKDRKLIFTLGKPQQAVNKPKGESLNGGSGESVGIGQSTAEHLDAPVEAIEAADVSRSTREHLEITVETSEEAKRGSTSENVETNVDGEK